MENAWINDKDFYHFKYLFMYSGAINLFTSNMWISITVKICCIPEA